MLFPSNWSKCAAVFTLEIFILWAARIFSKQSLNTKIFSVEFIRHDCRPAPRFSLADFGNDFLKGPTNDNDFWALLHINANGECKH